MTLLKEGEPIYIQGKGRQYKKKIKDDLIIDRIDPDKGYTKDNCQWITQSENSKKRNKQRKTNGRD